MKIIQITMIFILTLMCGCSDGVNAGKEIPVPLVEKNDTDSFCPKDAKTLVSWNAMNFGSKKSDDTIGRMARLLTSRGIEFKDKKTKLIADIILLQEVNSRIQSGGPQAVSRLQDSLGQDWDSITSNPTSGDGVERYATFWRKSTFIVNHREATLVNDLADLVDREPFGVRFSIGDKSFWTYGFHAVPKAKTPLREVKAVASSSEITTRGNIILAGDFNLGKNTIAVTFLEWKYHIDEKTSLKSTLETDGSYRAFQYDHILTRGKVKVCESGVIDFVSIYFSPVTIENLKHAREVSDHLPVYIKFTIEGKALIGKSEVQLWIVIILLVISFGILIFK